MNERIRELAIEARQEFLKLPTGYTPEQVGMYPQLMEKFAELIVEECCRRLGEETIRHDGYGYNQHELYNRLRKHFGVAE